MTPIITVTPGSGIGSAIIGIVHAVEYMHLNNIPFPLRINLTHASLPVKVLLTQFLDMGKIPHLQTCILPADVIYNPDLKNHQVITRGEYDELWYVPKVFKNTNFDIQCDIFENTWIIKEDVLSYMHEETSMYNNIDICINIRRGDKITLEPSMIQGSIMEYIEAIEKIERGDTLFHTSDDYSTFLEFKEQRPLWNISTFCSSNDTGYFLKDLNSESIEHVTKHVQKFMKELEIMKQAKWFVGTRTTNVGLMVDLMRRGKNNIFIY